MSTWDNEPEEDRAADAAGQAVVPGHDRPLEADEADAIEQAVPAAPAAEGEGSLPHRLDVPLEASEADVIDQALTVTSDDDDTE